MKTLYECETCRSQYTDKKKALACEAQGVPTNIKVGDIVKKSDGYGWFTGPDHWVMRNAGEHNGTPLMNFYWLVIEIKENTGSNHGRHCNEVTCVTRGVVNGPSVDGAGDWGIHRFNHYLDEDYSRHWPVVAEDVPQLVIDEAAAFMAHGFTVDQREVKVTTKKGEGS